MKYEPLKIGDLTAEIPIVQGGMGVGISLGGLAGAVAKEGAVGIISTAQIGYREPDFEQNPKDCNLRAIRKEYAKAREIAGNHGIIGFNIMVALRFYEEQVREAVEAGADIIISGAGLPMELPKFVEGSKTKIAPIVSSEKSARVILKYWDKKYQRTADMIVIEGPKAGGHLGFSVEQLNEYEQLADGEQLADREQLADGEQVEECGAAYDSEIEKIRQVVLEYEKLHQCTIPVVVAGGIDSSEEMERVMSLGVQGVQVATRFVTTEECDAALNYKQAYIKAKKEDICIVKSPVGMPGRAIKNAFMERVMSGEKISPEKCLGCLQKCNPKEIPYCITEALIHAAKGETEDALLFCGANAYKADSIQTVKEVIDSLAGLRV